MHEQKFIAAIKIIIFILILFFSLQRLLRYRIDAAPRIRLHNMAADINRWCWLYYVLRARDREEKIGWREPFKLHSVELEHLFSLFFSIVIRKDVTKLMRESKR